jgi:hypothetical protein
MLDAAQRRWPDVHDRKELLLRLTAAGSEAIAAEQAGEDRAKQRVRQQDALHRAAELVDTQRLLDDSAWR